MPAWRRARQRRICARLRQRLLGEPGSIERAQHRGHQLDGQPAAPPGRMHPDPDFAALADDQIRQAAGDFTGALIKPMPQTIGIDRQHQRRRQAKAIARRTQAEGKARMRQHVAIGQDAMDGAQGHRIDMQIDPIGQQLRYRPGERRIVGGADEIGAFRPVDDGQSRLGPVIDPDPALRRAGQNGGDAAMQTRHGCSKGGQAAKSGRFKGDKSSHGNSIAAPWGLSRGRCHHQR